MACAYPDKKLGICMKGNSLLPTMPPQCHDITHDFLKTRNVHILYNTPYVQGLEHSLGFDRVYKCVGQRFRSAFMERHFSSSIAPNGQLYVNEYMQLSSVDPTFDATKTAKANVFVFGDVSRTRIHEVKNIPSMKFLAPFLSDNVTAVAQGKQPQNKIPQKLPVYVAISLGPKDGIFVQNDVAQASEAAALSKFDYTDMYIKMFGGSVELIKDQKKVLCDAYTSLNASLVY